MKTRCIALAFTILLAGCSALKTPKTSKQARISSYTIHAGVNRGGIVDDTSVDAVSGATQNGIHLGVHPVVRVGRVMLETGIDVQTYNQSFTFLDYQSNPRGKRNFWYLETNVPVTYNLQLFQDEEGKGRFLIKPGLNFNYRIAQQIDNEGRVPDYTFDRFYVSPLLGLATAPIPIGDKLAAGFYAEVMRTTQVYQDTYSVQEEAGGMSYMRMGLRLRLETSKQPSKPGSR